MGLFQAIEFSNGEIILDYHDSEGLLKSIRYPNGDFRLYDYDKNGHVLEVSTDTGKSISLKAKPCLDLTKNSQCVEVFSDGDLMQKIRVDQSGTVVFHEQKGKLEFCRPFNFVLFHLGHSAILSLTGKVQWRVKGI